MSSLFYFGESMNREVLSILSILLIIMGIVWGIANIISIVQADYIQLYKFTEDFTNATIHDPPYDMIVYISPYINFENDRFGAPDHSYSYIIYVMNSTDLVGNYINISFNYYSGDSFSSVSLRIDDLNSSDIYKAGDGVQVDLSYGGVHVYKIVEGSSSEIDVYGYANGDQAADALVNVVFVEGRLYIKTVCECGKVVEKEYYFPELNNAKIWRFMWIVRAEYATDFIDNIQVEGRKYPHFQLLSTPDLVETYAGNPFSVNINITNDENITGQIEARIIDEEGNVLGSTTADVGGLETKTVQINGIAPDQYGTYNCRIEIYSPEKGKVDDYRNFTLVVYPTNTTITVTNTINNTVTPSLTDLWTGLSPLQKFLAISGGLVLVLLIAVAMTSSRRKPR